MIAPGRPGNGFFFVMGAPKSGTTWVQAMLNAHPQVSCFGEGDFIERIAQPMETMLRHYNQQLGIVSERVYSGTAPYTPLGQGDVRVLVRATIVGLMRRAGPGDSLWWGDKTPAYARQIESLHLLFPKARYIHVVRDPRDTAVSALYHAKRAGVLADLDGDAQGRLALIVNAVTRWRDTVQNVARHSQILGPRLLQLRYNDLVDDTPGQIRRAFAHLGGVSLAPATIAELVAQTSFQAMSGGRNPGETDNTSFFRNGTTGQHRLELTATENALIEDRLSDPMHAYGF